MTDTQNDTSGTDETTEPVSADVEDNPNFQLARYDLLTSLEKFNKRGVDVDVANQAYFIAKQVHGLFGESFAKPMDLPNAIESIQKIEKPVSNDDRAEMAEVFRKATQDINGLLDGQSSTSNDNQPTTGPDAPVDSSTSNANQQNEPKDGEGRLRRAKQFFFGKKESQEEGKNGLIPSALASTKTGSKQIFNATKRGWKGAAIGTVFLPGIGTIAGWAIDSFFISNKK